MLASLIHNLFASVIDFDGFLAWVHFELFTWWLASFLNQQQKKASKQIAWLSVIMKPLKQASKQARSELQDCLQVKKQDGKEANARKKAGNNAHKQARKSQEAYNKES